MTEKLCVFCKHFQIDEGNGCPTCGWSASFGCGIDKMKENNLLHVSESEFRKLILTAKKCNEYEVAKDDQ